MKTHLIFVILLFAALVASGRLGAQHPSCPEIYAPVYINPNPVDGDTYSPPPPTPPGAAPTNDFRGIYWVHGLGGGVNSWASARTATELGAANYPARKVKGHLMTYPTTSLPAAGLDMVTTTENLPLVPDPSLNFAIAHSQGGLVARTADLILHNGPQYERNLHGIVTFGTPHAGAKILDSRDNGMTDAFVVETCNAFLTGPAFALVEDHFPGLVQLFIRPQTISNTVEAVCEGGGAVLPFVLQDLYAGTTNDYHTGAAFLEEELNDFDHPDIHKAVFTGVEYSAADNDDPSNPKQLLWRTMSSYDGGSGTPGFFTEDADDQFVQMANEVTAMYEAEYQEADFHVFFLEAQGWPCTGIDWFFNPVGCIFGNAEYYNAVDKRNAFERAYEWMLDADRQWKIIIGALEFQPQNLGQPNCTCQWTNNLDGWSFISGNSSVDNEPDCLAYTSNVPGESVNCWWDTFITQPVYKPSDGIVTEETAAAFPGAAVHFRMPETNHFQMRNCSETRTSLTQLFNGDAGDGWFFTPKQQ